MNSPRLHSASLVEEANSAAMPAISNGPTPPRMDHQTTRDGLVDRNRANAQHSSGPRTEAGKAISKLNAVKSGLTGRTVVLPSDDVARYEQHVLDWQSEFNPQGPRESSLVQSVADAYWRAERILRLEFALYAQGHLEASRAEDNGSSPNGMATELDTHLRYEKQLRNLSIQESRIRRQREKDLRELQQLQEKRLEQVEEGKRAQAKAAGPNRSTAADKGVPVKQLSSVPSLGMAAGSGVAAQQPNFTTKSGFEFSTAHLRNASATELNFRTPNMTGHTR